MPFQENSHNVQQPFPRGIPSVTYHPSGLRPFLPNFSKEQKVEHSQSYPSPNTNPHTLIISPHSCEKAHLLIKNSAKPWPNYSKQPVTWPSKVSKFSVVPQKEIEFRTWAGQQVQEHYSSAHHFSTCSYFADKVDWAKATQQMQERIGHLRQWPHFGFKSLLNRACLTLSEAVAT